MSGPDFILCINGFVHLLTLSWTMLDTITLVGDGTYRLTVYGLSIFLVFAGITADLLNELRTGNNA